MTPVETIPTGSIYTLANEAEKTGMDITLYRDHPIQSTPSMLPATTYNLARTLLSRSPHGAVFVPIRAMQYLAILDKEECVFVDSQFKDQVEIAWQHFRPQARTGLDEPVPYDVLVYRPEGLKKLTRLLGEFTQALQFLALKEHPDGPATVLKFEARTPPT